MSLFHIYSTGHKHSRVVCDALAEGTGFAVVPPAPLLKGGLATYGFLRGLLPTLRQARMAHRPWVYADRGYFKPTYGEDYRGYFRLTRNAWQHSGKGVADPTRWRKLKLVIEPWKKDGRHILVCPPGDVFTEAVGGFASSRWVQQTLFMLSHSTDRPVRIRQKSEAEVRPLVDDLHDAFALVTYMSNTAVEALLFGVPVFCTGPCAAQAMGRTSLAEIERPLYRDDRERWAEVLADNQWTLDEVREGLANHLFNDEEAK